MITPKSTDVDHATGLPILHPSVLVLTKLKRWANIQDSTHPTTKAKALTDIQDIKFLVNWLFRRDLTINVSSYHSAKPERLYQALKVYHEHLQENGPMERLDEFRKVVGPDDRKMMGGKW